MTVTTGRAPAGAKDRDRRGARGLGTPFTIYRGRQRVKEALLLCTAPSIRMIARTLHNTLHAADREPRKTPANNKFMVLNL